MFACSYKTICKIFQTTWYPRLRIRRVAARPSVPQVWISRPRLGLWPRILNFYFPKNLIRTYYHHHHRHQLTLIFGFVCLYTDYSVFTGLTNKKYSICSDVLKWCIYQQTAFGRSSRLDFTWVFHYNKMKKNILNKKYFIVHIEFFTSIYKTLNDIIIKMSKAGSNRVPN